MAPRLIVTSDDFGLDTAVNEAVEIAHRQGVVTSASLMVGAPAAADAVARARRLPELRVGLHLALVDALPVLPPMSIPALVGRDGHFPARPLVAGVRYGLRPGARAALRREIRAQFEAFAATGLDLDHADSHHHLHLHPGVASAALEIGREFGLRAMRVPSEPRAPLRGADPTTRVSRLAAGLLAPLVASLRRRVRAGGLFANDHLFGIAWSGSMTEARLVGLLQRLPEGVCEVYAHPATDRSGPGAELVALTSPEVRRAVDRRGAILTSYGELGGEGS